MSAHNADNEGIKVVDQVTRRPLVALTHTREAASQIERLNVVLRHKRMEARTCTTSKTAVFGPSYTLADI